MAKYQTRKLGTDWKDCEGTGGPNIKLKDLLDYTPHLNIRLTEPSNPNVFTEWRIKPRDEELIEQIRNALVDTSHMFDNERANAIYDLLEDKGLV